MIGASQIDAITTALKALPANISAEDYQSAEKILVDLAREAGPRAITRAGCELHTRLDPDGDLPSETQLAAPHRELRIHTRRDGWIQFTGVLDPETGAELKTLLSPLAAPQPRNDTGMDLRDAGERQGDALAEIVALASRGSEVPTEAGERPHLVVTPWTTAPCSRESGTRTSTSREGSRRAKQADSPATLPSSPWC